MKKNKTVFSKSVIKNGIVLKILFSLCLGLLGVLYVYSCIDMAVFSRLSLMDSFRAVEYDDDLLTRIDRKTYDSIDRKYSVKTEEIGKQNINVNVIFAINNIFWNGLVWAVYDYDVYNKNGIYGGGSRNVPVLLFVIRSGFVWKIVDKNEEN